MEYYKNILKVNTKSKYLSFKFTSIADLEKVENYRLKKKILKRFMKMEKAVIKFGDIEIEK